MYATHLWIIYDYVLLKISEVLAILHNILYVMTTVIATKHLDQFYQSQK